MKGRIIRGIAGFYYVHDGKDVYECRAKGIFRKNREKPLVGDNAEFTVLSEAEKTGSIESISGRTSRLFRPEVANVDRIFLVFAAEKPEPNFDMLNRCLIMMADSGIETVLVMNKTDLVSEEKRDFLSGEFRNTGLTVLPVSALTGAGIPELREAMKGRVSVLSGPSGAGKSSLMNRLMMAKVMETGELSRRVSRGKQTTRHTELFPLGENTYLLDTPGFTSVYVDAEQDELRLLFPEIAALEGKCRFTVCHHLA